MKTLRGFTLVELVIFMVIVGIAVGGVTLAFVQSTRTIHEPVIRQRALAVANAYMDEILRKRWNENTPVEGGCVQGGAWCSSGLTAAAIGVDAGEAGRADYDDLDDYAGITDEAPTDQSGNPMPGYAGFSVTVTVDSPAWAGIASADVRRVTVAVRTPTGETLSVRGYRVNY
jgi:MSHA pilin protein MshD